MFTTENSTQSLLAAGTKVARSYIFYLFSASEVTTLRRYTNLFIIIIIKSFFFFSHPPLM